MIAGKFVSARAFARHILASGHVPIDPHPDRTQLLPGMAVETVIYRAGQYQIEFIVMFPDAVIPSHCHPGVDSCELWLGGDGVGVVGDRMLPYEIGGDRLKSLAPIGADIFHSGLAGKKGAVFLSFQKWADGKSPTFISDSWQAE